MIKLQDVSPGEHVGVASGIITSQRETRALLSDVDQCRVAAAIISRQWQQAAVRQGIERAMRTPEVQSLVRSLMAPKPRPRVASHHPAIIERRQPQSQEQRARDYIAAGQATLARSKREEAEIRRKVARERAGAR